MSSRIELIPFETVGGIGFGKDIRQYLDAYDFRFTPAKPGDVPNWDEYCVDELAMEVYTDNNMVASICMRRCIFVDGVDLFQLDFKELTEYLDSLPDAFDALLVGDETEPHDVFDFDEFGIQLWMKHGSIDAVFCSD